MVASQDSREQFEKRRREMNTPKALFFKETMKHKFWNSFDMFRSFLNILREYEYGRIDPDNMYQKVSKLFSLCPVLIRGFSNSFLQPMSTKDADVETPRPVKKAKIGDGSAKATTLFDPTSHASTSYAITSYDYFQSPSSRASYPLESEAVASCSSSSSSRLGAAEAHETQQKKTAQSGGRTLYVSRTKSKNMDDREAYEHIVVLVNQIGLNRFDTYAIMVYASECLREYPELIENFNVFLPDGYKIVLSDGRERNTD